VSYYFPHKTSLKKKREAIKELERLLAIENETKQYFLDLSAENDYYLHNYIKWEKYTNAWGNRIQTIMDASFRLTILEEYDELRIEEAFCILLGVSPETLDGVGFLDWSLTELPTLKRLEKENYYSTNRPNHEIVPTFWNIEEGLIRCKEFKKIDRQFGHTVNTEKFIQWALKIGYIEEDTHHMRDNRNAPYEEDFSIKLYNELLANDLIRGDFQEKWVWNTNTNTLNFLVRLLHQNQVPRKWHSDNPHTARINWTNIQHYISYSGQRALRKATSTVLERKEQIAVENVIDKILEEYERDSRGREDLLDY